MRAKIARHAGLTAALALLLCSSVSCGAAPTRAVQRPIVELPSAARTSAPPATAAPATAARTTCLLADPDPLASILASSPASSRAYLGSPSLLRLADGTWLASHDIFGPGRPQPPHTVVYASADGARWERVNTVVGQYWSGLFEHRGAVYLMGPQTGLGPLVIRRSEDAGRTFTEPRDEATGLLRADGRYHTAPVPVVEHDGRLYRAVERLEEPGEWPRSLAPIVLSAAIDADLLRAASWVSTPPLPFTEQPFGGVGFFEGNIVIGRGGEIFDVLRVDVRGAEERAAVLRLDVAANSLAPAATPRIALPGSSKKFTIRFDPTSGRYWTLVNDLPQPVVPLPAAVRNRLSIASSPDLRSWTVHATLLAHPDVESHGFQYADFQFDGDDLVFLSRTSHDYEGAAAGDYHNSNLLTAHRVVDFRACAR